MVVNDDGWKLTILKAEPNTTLELVLRNQRNRYTIIPAPLGIESNRIEYGSGRAVPIGQRNQQDRYTIVPGAIRHRI